MAYLSGGPLPFAKRNLDFVQKKLHSSYQTMSLQSRSKSSPCVLHIKIDIVSEMLVSLIPNHLFHSPVAHSLKIALQKPLSFSTFALQASALYCNVHIKLDVKFCAQARLFTKVVKSSEASLQNCVFVTSRPFKNTVRYFNSCFWAYEFS